MLISTVIFPLASYGQIAIAPPDNMVFVSGGTFQMGDLFGDGENNEKPTKKVTVSDFHIGIDEVSIADFSEFIALSKYTTSAEKRGYSIGLERSDAMWSSMKLEGVNWRFDNFGVLIAESEFYLPVSYVSWRDAVHYSNWKSKKEGLIPVYKIRKKKIIVDWTANGYRLPTEIEWEYAARSKGLKEKWSGTSDLGSLHKVANYCIGDAICDEGGKRVGQQPNKLGIYNMSGNLFEWCWDTYSEVLPTNQRPQDYEGGFLKVVRGGSWRHGANECRVSRRRYENMESSNFSIGFRLARSY